jgi:hypothetical protein
MRVLATLEDPWLIRKILEHLVAQYVLWALMNNAAQVTVEEGLAGTPAVDDVIGSHRPRVVLPAPRARYQLAPGGRFPHERSTVRGWRPAASSHLPLARRTLRAS